MVLRNACLHMRNRLSLIRVKGVPALLEFLTGISLFTVPVCGVMLFNSHHLSVVPCSFDEHSP
jgi:hypothetical protein